MTILKIELEVNTTKNTVTDKHEAYFTHPFLDGALVAEAATKELLASKLEKLTAPDQVVSIDALFESANRVKQSFLEAKKAIVG